jgi:hypothetical protein
MSRSGSGNSRFGQKRAPKQFVVPPLGGLGPKQFVVPPLGGLGRGRPPKACPERSRRGGTILVTATN